MQDHRQRMIETMRRLGLLPGYAQDWVRPQRPLLLCPPPAPAPIRVRPGVQPPRGA